MSKNLPIRLRNNALPRPSDLEHKPPTFLRKISQLEKERLIRLITQEHFFMKDVLVWTLRPPTSSGWATALPKRSSESSRKTIGPIPPSSTRFQIFPRPPSSSDSKNKLTPLWSELKLFPQLEEPLRAIKMWKLWKKQIDLLFLSYPILTKIMTKQRCPPLLWKDRPTRVAKFDVDPNLSIKLLKQRLICRSTNQAWQEQS